jgi:hypothetical protein
MRRGWEDLPTTTTTLSSYKMRLKQRHWTWF